MRFDEHWFDCCFQGEVSFSLNNSLNNFCRGDMIGMFVGHDHANDYIIEYEGLYIGYGRKTGYGCYGPPPG